MKKMILFLSLILIVILTGCGDDSSGDESSGEKEIKLAHSGSETHQYHIAAKKFKEVLESNEDVNISVNIHSNAALGSEGDAIEQVLNGSLEMTTVAADSNLANTVPEMNLFGIPFIFEDKDHVYKALKSEAGQNLLKIIDEKGMKGMGYWEVGFRHLSNDQHEISTPDDVENLSIRIQPASVWEMYFTSLGANPIPVDFNELYSALDQGVVDGQENPLPTVNSMKLYEVQQYITLTAHTYTPAVVLMSETFYNNLSAEEVSAVNQAILEAQEYQREELNKQEKDILNMLEKEGITVTEPDREAFEEATLSVRDDISEKVPSEIIQSFIDSQE